MTKSITSKSRVAFGRRIVQLRVEQGFTQLMLAQCAGINRSYLSGIENGTRNISLDNITKLADALGVNIADLFDDTHC